ncbi:APC family permease [Kyrpidia sp.]|uniref:APC family permease n=1 Tax=Kyrpidia sp. TaxID=2073077 RepID=UPI00258349FD|nr:APC family permease [Kyrpidia sp.]MCL6575454.1 APC family permease [Kyrpidia sp.]
MGSERSTRLKANALNFFDNTVIGVASTAPAYSLAASLGGIVAVVGFMSPALLLWNFVPMIGIACAFYYLNKYVGPSAGGVYSWVSTSLNRYLGYMSGWAIAAAGILFLISGSVPAGTYTLALINPDLSDNPVLVSLVSAAWFIVVTFIVVRGIEITAKFQWVLLLIEYVVLLVFAGVALYRVYGVGVPGSTPIHWSWFTFHGSLADFASATTIALFFYWGFDTITNLGEESKDARNNPGWAGVTSVIALLIIFLVVSISVQALIPEEEIVKHQDDILSYFAGLLAPHPWSDLMILSVLSSTVATLETTLLPSARVSYEMAVDRVLPEVFGKVHPSWKTPHIGTLIIAAISFIGIFSINLSSSVGSFLENAASNVGIMVAYYYGISGVTSAWFLRKRLTDWRILVFGFVLPLLSGLYLVAVGIIVLLESGFSSSLPALVAFALGLPVMAYYAFKNRAWFRSPEVPALSEDVLVGGAKMDQSGDL